MPSYKPDPSYQTVAGLFADARSFFLTAHLRPDGDAIGSLSGLGKSLQKAGKHVEYGLVDPVPDKFAFLMSGVPVLGLNDFSADRFDLVVALDTGTQERTGFPLVNGTGKLVNIDHHASNTFFGDTNIVDCGASSTCEMVYELITQASLPLDAEVAESLYLGLLTDSRFFQNEQLRPSAHRAAAGLLEAGLDSRRVLSMLTASRALAELRLLGRGFYKTKLQLDGKLITVTLTKRDLDACKATWNQAFSCGLFNQLTSVEGVLASVAVVEADNGQVFCEFRSRGGFSVKEVALAMGGGGHLAASGCNRNGPVQQVAREAIRRTRAQLQQFLACP